MKFTLATAGTALLFALVAHAAPQTETLVPITVVEPSATASDSATDIPVTTTAAGTTGDTVTLTPILPPDVSQSASADSNSITAVESVTGSVSNSGSGTATVSTTGSAPIVTGASSTGVAASGSSTHTTGSSAASASSTGRSNGAMPTGFAKREGLAMGLGAGLLAAALL